MLFLYFLYVLHFIIYSFFQLVNLKLRVFVNICLDLFQMLNLKF